MNKPLDSRYPRQLKTATALLLNADGELVYFGFRAYDAYEELHKRHEEGAYSFFENFKLALYTARDVNANTPVAATNGREWPIGHLIKLAIDSLRKEAVKELKQQEGHDDLQHADIRWVLTVPAIWSTTAKRVMRQAAYHAGLSSAKDEQQLLVVHEPEACALAVRPLLMRAALEPDFEPSQLDVYSSTPRASHQLTDSSRCQSSGGRGLRFSRGLRFLREGLVAMDNCVEPLIDRKSLSCKRIASGRRSDILRQTSAMYLR